MAIAKDSTKTYLKMTVGVDVVSKELSKTFPATADKVFLPEQKRVQTLNEWISAPYVHSRTHAYPSSDHA